jgi:GGDEF domain-containing protein
MGLYSKATTFLQVAENTDFDKEKFESFLKGSGLLKKITSEKEDDHSNSIIINDVNEQEEITDSDHSLTLKDTEIKEESKILPDDLLSNCIVLEEDSEIEFDISNQDENNDNDQSSDTVEDSFAEQKSNEDEITETDVDLESDFKEIEDNFEDDKIIPSDTVEVGSDPIDEDIKEWEEDAAEESEDLKESSSSDDVSKKLDNYLVISEITKELVQSSTFNDFYDNLMYSIEGQLGPNYIIILFSIDERYEEYEIISYDGIDLSENVILNSNSGLIQDLIQRKGIIKSRDLNLNELSESEKKIISLSENEIIASIVEEDDLLAFIIIGESSSGEVYQKTDIEFITVLMDFCSSVIHKLYEQERLQREFSELTSNNLKIELLNSFSSEIIKTKSYNNLFSKLFELFGKFEINYNFSAYVIDSKNNYKLVYSTETDIVQDNSIKVDEVIIKEIKSSKKQMSLNDLTEIKRMNLGLEGVLIIPLFEGDNLISLLLINNSLSEDETYKNQIISLLFNVITSQLSRIIASEKIEEVNSNPLLLLERKIRDELILAKESEKNFILYVIRIQNTGRIISLLGNNYLEEYSEYIKQVISTNILETDYVFQVGQSKFCIFLRNKTEIDFSAIQVEIKEGLNTYPNSPKDFKISIQIYSLEFPTQSLDIRKYIELIEET